MHRYRRYLRQHVVIPRYPPSEPVFMEPPSFLKEYETQVGVLTENILRTDLQILTPRSEVRYDASMEWTLEAAGDTKWPTYYAK